MSGSRALISVAIVLSACHEGRVGRPRNGAALEAPGMPAAWNERLIAVASAEDGLLTLKGVRTAAMMHLAMHDALNATARVYAPYVYLAADRGADPVAAAARAAYDVAVSQYPDAGAAFADELEQWLARAAAGQARLRGIALGESVAATLIRAREGDGWNAQVDYDVLPPSPGVYATFPEHSGTPAGFVFGAGWGHAQPFLLEPASQFRSPPPPALDSEAYARAFLEVAEVGRFDSATRTVDQTHLAFFWKEFAESSLNRLARELTRAEDYDLWSNARLFALLNASIFDGYVSVFENKYFYNHWRPYTAIRAADSDGNDRTQADPQWDNTHHHTYPFPSYPSAHGTVCAAAFTVLTDVLGDDRAFSMTTPEVTAGGPMSGLIAMDPPTRSFASFADAALECAQSRVYLGIHFRYDSEAGNELGRRIGVHELATFARPL